MGGFEKGCFLGGSIRRLGEPIRKSKMTAAKASEAFQREREAELQASLAKFGRVNDREVSNKVGG